jgi:hypothetical protein
MKNQRELLLSVALLLVLFLKLDPLHWLMPNMIQMVILCIFAAAFALYAGVIFREKAQDERESSHLYRASRIGYLVGVISLSIIIVVQDVQHQLDPYLLIVLGLMIVTKLIALKYSQIRH